MSNYITNDTDLTIVADAIRTKGGTSGSLTYPNGFATAIANLPSGGSENWFPKKLTNGKIEQYTENFTYAFPSAITEVGENGLKNFYNIDSNFKTYATKIDFNNITTVSGDYGFQSAFSSCSNITEVDFGNLTTIDGEYAFSNIFSGCTSLNEAILDKLTTMQGTNGMASAFSKSGITNLVFKKLNYIKGSRIFQDICSSCTSLQNVYFPSLTPSSFGTSNCFARFLSSTVVGCNVHFPKSVQSTISSWSSITGGLTGTNTVVLYDLVQTITINGVNYTQSYDDSITNYKAFKNGTTICYVPDNVEPAVGDTAYSDGGTTSFGTITAIA